MAKIKEVLLLAPVKKLGGEGDFVHVKAGYARNYLIPRGTALPIEKANRRQIEALKKARALREEEELAAANARAKKIAAARVIIAVKTGENGKLFGSVTATDIIQKLAEQEILVDRDMLQLLHPLKELGQHKVCIKLHVQVNESLVVEIVSENPVLADA